MGETSANVQNKSGDKVYIYCTSGQEDKKAGLNLEFKDYKKIGKFETVQFVVDGKNYALGTQSGTYEAVGRSFFNDLYSVVIAISEAKSGYFTVEIPEKNIARRFSALNAADRLGKPPQTLIDPCS